MSCSVRPFASILKGNIFKNSFYLYIDNFLKRNHDFISTSQYLGYFPSKRLRYSVKYPLWIKLILWIEIISCEILFYELREDKVIKVDCRNNSKMTAYCRKVILNTSFNPLNFFSLPSNF